MAIAGLTLAIIAIVLSFVPCISVFAVLPAILGIVFSIIGLVQARTTKQHKWIALPGLVFSVTAVIWPLLFWFLIFGAISGLATALTTFVGIEQSSMQSMGGISWTPPSTTQSIHSSPLTPAIPGTPRTSPFTAPASSSSGPFPPASNSMGTATPPIALPTRDPGHAAAPTDIDAEARRDIKKEVDALRNSSGREGPAGAWTQARLLRDRTNALAVPGDLHYQLDMAIVALLDNAAREHYERAMQLYNAQDFHAALNVCNKALAAYGDDTARPSFHDPARVRSPVYDQAYALSNQIRYWTDPSLRFELRGFVGVNDENVANVYDHARGAWTRLRVDDVVDGFRVNDVNRQDKSIELEANGVRTRLR